MRVHSRVHVQRINSRFQFYFSESKYIPKPIKKKIEK